MIKIRLATLICLAAFITSGSYAQITPPYFDDFEGANAGWTVDSISGSTWELGTPTTAPTNSTYSGVNAWDVDLLNPYLPGTECYLVSPVFDFSTPSGQDAVLSFWQNRSTEAGWDGTRVDYSTNAGASWTVLGVVNDPNAVNWYNAGGLGSSGLSGWDGNSGGWVKSSYPLTILNGNPAVMFRFAFTSDNGTQVAGFSMDDFEVAIPVTAAQDAGVSAILDPNAGSLGNSVSDVNVIVENFGTDTLTTFPVYFEVNGAVLGNVTWNGVLVQGATDTVNVGSFTVPVGNYDICAYTVLPGDGDGSNDTLCVSLFGVDSGIYVTMFDSLGFVDCINPPITDQFIVFGTASSMNDGDTINVSISFGDGSDTTFITQVFTGFFSTFIDHTYLFSGQFSTQIIATDNTGSLSDTAINYNQLVIGDTCGNITGTVYADLNGNCVFDVTDLPLSGIPVYLYQAGNLVRTYYSNPNGSYFFVVPSATAYDLMVDTGYAGITSYCPASGAINGVTEPSAGNDFGLVTGSGYDLEPQLNPFSIRLNGSNTLWLYLANNYFAPVNGTLMLVIDTNLLPIVSIAPVPDAVSGDTIIWNATNLTSNSTGFMAALGVAPGSLALGDSVCLTVIADPLTGDSVPGNNVKTVCGTVVNSYDPNNKMVDVTGDFEDPDGHLTYTINFQNTGNAPAFNVFLLDTIDSDLDISTLHVISSSHLYSTTIVDPSVVKFSFNNIFLPDSASDEPGSHGYITYSIAPKPGLTNGTQITNTAGIYFDFNSAIVTNTTTNTVNYPAGINELLTNNSIMVYPNPASDKIQIISAKAEGDLVVYDVYGKQVWSEKMKSRQTELTVKNWKAGVYFITLKTKNSQTTGKIIIAR